MEGLARAHATLLDDFKQVKQDSAIPAVRAGAPVIPAHVHSTDTAIRELDREEASKSNSKSSLRHDSKRGRAINAGLIDLEREELRKGSVLNDDSSQAGLYGGAPADFMSDAGNSLEGGLTREGDSFYGALALPSVSRGVIETQIHGERLELSSNVPLRSASAKVHRLIQEGGASPNVIDELMSCLPSRHESDAMLEWFFRDINDSRLPLHERTFRASYEEIMHWRWGTLRDEEGDDGARHIPFLAFLFVILAIAKRSEPVDRCPSDELARRGALFYLHCARRSMAIASAVRADHIDVLLAALYGARLLITLRQSAESWSLLGVAIRAAQAIGLHRDGTKLGLDAVTTERRRRLWAMIYYLDRTTSMLLGRPQAIDDKTADTLPPSDVDIDVLPRLGPAPVPTSFPPAEIPYNNKLTKPPGVFCYIAIRHALAKLVGRIVEHFQDLSRQRSYADVMQLDADLQRFYEAIPGPFLYTALHGEKADRSYDHLCPWLPIHRYLLNVEYHYVRNALHRPYLLRSERYRQSREAAFASAKADRIIRREYVKEVDWPTDRARNSHLGGVYRKFASALIAGIELLLDPSGPNAAELHEYLDAFLNQSTKAADPSQCTKRELAIIKIFKAKATDPSWCAATATGANGARKAAEAARKGSQQQPRSAAGPPAAARARSASGANSASTPATGAPIQAISPTTGRPRPVPEGAAARRPASRSEANELAQTLLDRLGGIESLSVLNSNQSPSSNSATSLELGAAGSGGGSHSTAAGVGIGPGSAANSSTAAALAGLGSLTTPSSLAGAHRGIGPGMSSLPLGAGNATPYPAAGQDAGTPMSQSLYGLTGGFDAFFDGTDGSNWLGVAAGGGGPLSGSEGAMNNSAGAEAAAGFRGNGPMGFGGGGGADDMRTPTSGMLSGGAEGVSENDFAGWGALVEAIVSGQEHQ